MNNQSLTSKFKAHSLIKKHAKKGIAVLLASTIVVGSFPFSITHAEEVQQASKVLASTRAYEFGTGKEVNATTLFNESTGFGFSDINFPTEATGWVSGVYNPRTPAISSGVATNVSDGTDYLAIKSKVWTETESTGYGVYTYENTSTLDFNLENADYTVTVDLVNPTTNGLTVSLEAEDISKASGISLAAGAITSQSFTTCLIDGKLNLKFLETSTGTTTTAESAAVEKSVYVSKVTLTKQADQVAGTVPTVFIASDSTVQTYESNYYPQTGWGQVLYSFFQGAESMVESETTTCGYSQSQTYSTPSVVIENRAIGGRSSKSFVEEGKLDDLLEDVKAGDYLLVQWGHNDATYSRPNRYVSSTEFAKWLQYYIDGAKQRGATPILVTPVARYSPNTDGTFNISFDSYRQVMLSMGAAQGVPVIDLGYYSSELCKQFGIEGAKVLFLKLAAGEYEGAYAGGVDDSTHLQYYGAYKFAQIVAKQIKADTSGQLEGLKAIIPDIAVPSSEPLAPTNVEMTSVGASSVSLKWAASQGTELYYIYRAILAEGQTIDSVDFTTAEKYSVSVNGKYTDGNCDGGKTYVYAIAGFNEKGVGAKSDKIQVTTKSSLYKYDFCQTTTDPTLDGWLQVTSTQMYTQTAGYGWTTAPGNGRYRANNGLADSNAMTDDFCLGNGTFAVDLPNGDYELKITACDLMAGTSTIKPAYTAEGGSIGGISTKLAAGTLSATVRVLDGQLTLTVGGTNAYINGLEITPLTLAPTNFLYQELTFEGSQANFLMNWGDVENAASYRVYAKSSTDTAYTIIKTITQDEKSNATTLPFTATLGETYSYYVTAVLKDGTETAPSNVLSIVMIDTNALPPVAPSNVSVTHSESTNMTLSWNLVEGAIKYNVYRSDRAEGTKGYQSFTKIGETTATTYVDTDKDVTANVQWFYKVQAVNAGGAGALSSTAVTTVTATLIKQKAETLSDRALYAIDLSGNTGAETRVSSATAGVYLSWRLFEADKNVTFTLYKNNEILLVSTVDTNYVDPTGTANDVYKVVGSTDVALGLTAKETNVWGNQYLELQLDKPQDQTMPDGSIATYHANDMSVGDLDGDGQYELIVKWQPNNAKDNSGAGYTGTTILDAYDMNMSTGVTTKMWRIDLGINIRSGAHYVPFQVWDMDGDGKAEVLCKTADGSKDGSGVVIGDATKDYRNSSGYVLSGPEFMTIFDGATGAVLDTTSYTPARGTVSAWGDAYGNRVDRFLSATAYLDGVNPYAVFCRGYYTRTCLTAYAYVNGKLEVYWAFDTDKIVTDVELTAQGNHGLSVNDVDHDGKDEIVYGSLVVDHNGTVKYSTELGHGDAMHVSDWIPSNEGLEIMQVHEHDGIPYHVEMHDAETGTILTGYFTGKDTGRGVAADVDPNYIGGEFWSIAGPSYISTEEPAWDSTNGGMFSSTSTLTNLIPISKTTPASNFSIFWDGDLLSEVFDHSFNNAAYLPLSINVKDWDYENKKSVTQLESTQVLTSNGTKGNAGLIADIAGDWREEIIVRCSDDQSKIRIYATTMPTEYEVPTLMENHDYRLGVAWQNVGYNQPANLSYLLSEGLITAQLKKGEVTRSSVGVIMTEASDGIYGHDVTGYEVYRADETGVFTKIDSLELNELIEVDASGKTIEKPVEYKFDFGSKAVKSGWTQINSISPTYETTGTYGFTAASKALGMTDKAYSTAVTADLLDVYNDCVLGWHATTAYEFCVKVPNGKYEVTYYALNGSGSQYNKVTVETTGLSDIRKGSSTVGEYSETVTVDVTDGVLNVKNISSKAANLAIYFNGLTVKRVVSNPTTTSEKHYLYTDTTAASDTTYNYKVAAIVDGKTSFMSALLKAKTLVDIASIVDFTLPDLVEDTLLTEGKTVIDLLPAEIDVLDQTGNKTKASITWDVSQVNLTVPGTYTLTGTIIGYATPIVKSLNILENKVIGYTPLAPIYAVVGTTVTLPQSITVNYLNGTTVIENVTWNLGTLNTSEVGVNQVVGTSASIPEVSMVVEMKNNYVVSVVAISMEADKDTVPILPTNVSATYADGVVKETPVQWDTTTLDMSKLGTVTLSGSVDSFAGKAILNLTIVNKAVYKFDFGVSSANVATNWTGITVNPKGGTATADVLGIAYSATKGYGFMNGSANIQGRSENYTMTGVLPSAVYTDFVIPDGNTFAVDLPNGIYSVEVIGGSAYKSTVKATIESSTVVSVSNAVNTYSVGTYNVTITDGQLNISFTAGATSRCNGLVIRLIELEKPKDTTPPIITIEEYVTTPTNQDIVVMATTNEGTLNTTSHAFSENGSFEFVATDEVGNVATKVVEITNIIKVQGISLDQPLLTTTVGSIVQLNATIKPTNAINPEVIWSVTSGSGIVTVENGLVTGVTVGEAIIRVTSVEDSSKFTECLVTVNPAPIIKANQITVAGNKDASFVKLNGILQMTASILPENTTNKEVVWSVKNGTGKATINENGLLTGTKVGTVTIIATAKDGSGIKGTKVINVLIPVSQITVVSLRGMSTVKVNERLQLFVDIAPRNATNDSVKWSVVSGTGEATVNSHGVLTGISAGTVTVVATSLDGSTVQGSKVITVVVPVKSISISSTNNATTVKKNLTLQLSALILPDNATTKDVTWKVMNITGKATITQAGVLTGVKGGIVMIVAMANDGSGVMDTMFIRVTN